jgi:hypothetical protein
VTRRLRPLPDGAVLILTPPRHILRRGAAGQLGARREAVVVEMVAPRHVVCVAVRRAGQCRGVGKRRELVLGAEGIEVEGERERGGGENENPQRYRNGCATNHGRSDWRELPCSGGRCTVMVVKKSIIENRRQVAQNQF